MKLKLVEINQETADVKTFVFEPEQALGWVAGQFMQYHLPHQNEDERKEKRWFTISSAPFTKKPSITTRFTPEKGSSFKNTLKNLSVGDEIEADAPEGDFVLEDPKRNLVFVAGGIGITPFHSILTQAANDKLNLNVHLLYGNRSEDIPFKKEFDGLAQNNPTLQIEYIIDPDKINTMKIQQVMGAVENPLLYISGPEPMVESLVKELDKAGLKEKDIKTDYFPGYINEYTKTP
jgi:ferredoxin-NADP reductase